MKRHVVLIGLPGAGKTVSGRRAARRLKARFVDVDEMIERAAGRSVRQIFAERGEAAFRALEADAVRRLLEGPAGVLSPGGGWAAQPGSIEAVQGRALTIWLEVEPRIALDRALISGARPVLDAADPLERMRELSASRQGRYERADVSINTTEMTPDEVGEKVAELARSLGGW